ncbi:hypothetical protein JYU34_003272 [Plutella xylostella]|uniref:Uncharacterized protein n=1 Tax=Plutella xylostella TaxID=51655 RepID=A0ABQ7QZL5_PLUXY|nr:hypothetical protein JYU34_003272 [Plutella xylostella]
MSTIIDESKYKLIEDELKDLELKEGPALDFLDDLLENVLDKTHPNQVGDLSDGKYESLSEGVEDERVEPQIQQSQDKTGEIETNQIHDSKLQENNIEETLKEPKGVIDTHGPHFNVPEHIEHDLAEKDSFNETKEALKTSKEFDNLTLTPTDPPSALIDDSSNNNAQAEMKEMLDPIEVSQNNPRKEILDGIDDSSMQLKPIKDTYNVLINPDSKNTNLIHDGIIKEAVAEATESLKEKISVPEI